MTITETESRNEPMRRSRATVLLGYVITPADLAALIDLGLTDSQLADYFGLTPDRIVSLKIHYGLSQMQ